MRRICRVLLALGLFGGCSVEASSPTTKQAAPAKAEAKPAAPTPAPTPEGVVAAKKVEPEPAPEPTPDPAPTPDAEGKAGPQEPGSDLAMKFRDPPWYRKTLFPDANVTSTARSEANENGLFQSHIVFELAKGTTLDGCVEHLEKNVGETVSNLKRETQPDGRIKVSGSTDRYAVTLICGEAKGAMRAYVAFEWTS